MKKVTLTYSDYFASGRKDFIQNKSIVDCPIKITHPNIFHEDINRGDEIVVAMKTGGSYRGWYLGQGNGYGSYAALCWFPSNNSFQLVHCTTTPILAEWSRKVSSVLVEVALEQIQKFKQSQANSFTFELKA